MGYISTDISSVSLHLCIRTDALGAKTSANIGLVRVLEAFLRNPSFLTTSFNRSLIEGIFLKLFS